MPKRISKIFFFFHHINKYNLSFSFSTCDQPSLRNPSKFIPSQPPSSSSLEASNRRDFHQSILSSTSTLIMSTSSESSKQKIVKWGIVGLGDVCAKKSGPAFWKCNGSQLVAVMRRTSNVASKWVDANVPGGKDACKGYDNIDDFLNHPELDAVYIATPPGSHLEIAKKVATSNGNILACYVEKPVGRCAAETEEMVNLFKDKNKLFFPAYISRAYERTKAVKKLIKDGTIGDSIISVSYTLKGTGGIRGMNTDNLPWRLDAMQSGGGLIMDVGCHVIDRIDYILGPLINVKGKALNRKSPYYNVEDYVELQAEIGPLTDSATKTSASSSVSAVGATVKCAWDFAAKEEESCDELIITGSNGLSLRMAAMSPSLPVNVVNDDNNEIIKSLSFDTPEHTAQPLIQLVTDEIRGIDGVQSPARGDNAVRTSKVLDMILGDYYGDRNPGFWSRSLTWPGKADSYIN